MKSLRPHPATSVRGILMAFPLQFRNSASTKLSAVPLTRNSSIFFPYTIIDSRPFLFQLRSHQVPAFAQCTLCFFAILLSYYGCIFFPFLIKPNGMDAPDQQRTDSSDFPSAYGIFRYDRQSSSPRCLSHQKSTCSIYIIFLLFSPVQKEASGFPLASICTLATHFSLIALKSALQVRNP